MDRSEITRRNPQTVGAAWQWLTFDQETRDTADLHFRDGILSLAGRRFDLVGHLSIVAAAGASRVSAQAVVVNNSGAVSFGYPMQSYNVGPGLVTAHAASWSGFCSRDRRVRIRVRSMDAPVTIQPTLTVTRW